MKQKETNVPILKNISTPNDLKKLNREQLNFLASEIREEIISVAQTGDLHLSSNLGAVEISIGSLFCFDVPTDKVFYDTGHQCYTHKILTSRLNKFNQIRKTNGLSGFPSMDESKYDVYSNGHSGCAISVALGFLKNKSEKNYVVPIVGDASIVNGQSFEALNQFSRENKRLIIVLNDNGMSISKSVGSLAKMLNQIKISSLFYGAEKAAKRIFSPKKDSNKFFSGLYNFYNYLEQKLSGKNFFQCLGYQYVGPIDGNDIKKVLKGFEKAKWYSAQGPVILHFKTKKGLGMKTAFNDENGKFHSINIKHQSPIIGDDVCKTLIGKIKKDKAIKIINPATIYNIGFQPIVDKFPENIIDVGIAEEHAISLASGMKLNGLKPIVSIYSSFMQRCYDQILNDWSNLNLPIVCLIDRADLSGGDGTSHHGIYDIGLLKNIPNAVVSSFRSNNQMEQLIELGLSQSKSPWFIRYPKVYSLKTQTDFKIKRGMWECVINKPTNKTCVLSFGPFVNDIAHMITKDKLNSDLINGIFIVGYNSDNLNMLKKYSKIIVYERCFKKQLAQDVIDFVYKNKLNIEVVAMNYDSIVGYGNLSDLENSCGMSLKHIKQRIN